MTCRSISARSSRSTSEPRRPSRRVLLAARPVRIGQDDVSANDRGLRAPDERPGCRRLRRPLMVARVLRWAFLAAALVSLVTACGMKSSTADTPPAGPSAPATTLPRTEGTLRLLTRQGYAESGWVPAVRAQHRLPGGGALRRQRREPAERRRRLCVRRRVDPGQRRLRGRPGRSSARAQPGARAAARPLPGAVPRSGGSARRAPPLRRLVHVDARLELWRKSIRKHAPATWAPLSWNTRARRGRVSLEDTPLEIGDAALSLRALRPALGITDPYALDETQFAAAVALDETTRAPRGRALAVARRRDRRVRRRPRRRRRGRLVHGRADPNTERRRRPHAAPRGRAGRDRPLDAGRPRTPPGLRVPLDAIRLGTRVQAQVARYFGAAPVNRDACARLGRTACRALHADATGALFKHIAFRHTPVENCGGGRICVPFALWEQTWNELRSS